MMMDTKLPLMTGTPSLMARSGTPYRSPVLYRMRLPYFGCHSRRRSSSRRPPKLTVSLMKQYIQK